MEEHKRTNPFRQTSVSNSNNLLKQITTDQNLIRSQSKYSDAALERFIQSVSSNVPFSCPNNPPTLTHSSKIKNKNKNFNDILIQLNNDKQYIKQYNEEYEMKNNIINSTSSTHTYLVSSSSSFQNIKETYKTKQNNAASRVRQVSTKIKPPNKIYERRDLPRKISSKVFSLSVNKKKSEKETNLCQQRYLERRKNIEKDLQKQQENKSLYSFMASNVKENQENCIKKSILKITKQFEEQEVPKTSALQQRKFEKLTNFSKMVKSIESERDSKILELLTERKNVLINHSNSSEEKKSLTRGKSYTIIEEDSNQQIRHSIAPPIHRCIPVIYEMKPKGNKNLTRPVSKTIYNKPINSSGKYETKVVIVPQINITTTAGNVTNLRINKQESMERQSQNKIMNAKVTKRKRYVKRIQGNEIDVFKEVYEFKERQKDMKRVLIQHPSNETYIISKHSESLVHIEDVDKTDKKENVKVNEEESKNISEIIDTNEKDTRNDEEIKITVENESKVLPLVTYLVTNIEEDKAKYKSSNHSKSVENNQKSAVESKTKLNKILENPTPTRSNKSDEKLKKNHSTHNKSKTFLKTNCSISTLKTSKKFFKTRKGFVSKVKRKFGRTNNLESIFGTTDIKKNFAKRQDSRQLINKYTRTSATIITKDMLLKNLKEEFLEYGSEGSYKRLKYDKPVSEIYKDVMLNQYRTRKRLNFNSDTNNIITEKVNNKNKTVSSPNTVSIYYNPLITNKESEHTPFRNNDKKTLKNDTRTKPTDQSVVNYNFPKEENKPQHRSNTNEEHFENINMYSNHNLVSNTSYAQYQKTQSNNSMLKKDSKSNNLFETLIFFNAFPNKPNESNSKSVPQQEYTPDLHLTPILHKSKQFIFSDKKPKTFTNEKINYNKILPLLKNFNVNKDETTEIKHSKMNKPDKNYNKMNPKMFFKPSHNELCWKRLQYHHVSTQTELSDKTNTCASDKSFSEWLRSWFH